MPLDPYYAKALLDWTTGAATATQPGGRWVMWATAVPDSANSNEGPWSPRQTVTFLAASTFLGGASAGNANALTSTATAAATATGWDLYESGVGGRRIAWGTTSGGNIGCKSGDLIAIPAGSFRILIA